MQARARGFAIAVMAVMTLLSGAAAADGPAPEAACEGGAAKVGWLGVTGIRARQLSVRQGDSPDDLTVWFGQEPEVLAVNGPARGRLRPGDVIAAVGGSLITTRAGGSLLARPEPGRPVTLTVRRDGRETQVEVTPWAVCPEDAFLPPPPAPEPPLPVLPPAAPEPPRAPAAPRAPEPPAAPRAPAVPRASEPPEPPRAPEAPEPVLAPEPPEPPLAPEPPEPPAAAAWFGIGFECRGCGWKDDDGVRSYFFSSPPAIFSVDPGSPAARAGLRRGDVLTRVDGHAITTAEGARRFFEAAPGAAVTLSYERDGAAGEATVRGDEPRLRGVLAAVPRADAEHLRYAGSLGDVDLEVRGLDSVHVTVDETRGTVVIRTRDAVVRLTRTDPEPES